VNLFSFKYFISNRNLNPLVNFGELDERFHVGYYRDHFISISLSLMESYLALSYVLPEPIVTVL